MKKKIVFLFLCLSLLPPVAISSFAHSGDTDSNGGHYDSNTGEYHYHHGYPAHSHRDLDGDGSIDCPYEFNDRTGYNSGSSSSDSYIDGHYDDISRSSKVFNFSNESKTEVVTKEVKYIPKWIYWVIGILSATCIAMLYKLLSHKSEITKMEDADYLRQETMRRSYERKLLEYQNELESLRVVHDKKMQDMEDVYRSRIVLLKASYENRLGEFITVSDAQSTLNSHSPALPDTSIPQSDVDESQRESPSSSSITSQIPVSITFTGNGMPVFWKPDATKPYGDFTVYVNKKSRIYHTDYLCASYAASKDHIFNVIDCMRPCKKCAEGFFDFTTVPDWYKQSK